MNAAEAVHVSSPLPVVQWPTYPTPTPEAARTSWNWMTGHDVWWLAYDLLYFLMIGGWTWSISRKSDGSCHDMVKNSSLDKDSDAMNFKKLRPALVFPSQPFCYFTSTATWQNVVPLPERESVELLGFRVFVFSQQKHCMRLWNACFWDVSCSSTFWLLKRDTCFLISRHHMLCSSKCG